ncbi:MAG: hypothetical protein GXO31_02125 [Epsilonproteobacteria bacterium]|nr:hypothetical protein [Campylobacterota bacterium]
MEAAEKEIEALEEEQENEPHDKYFLRTHNKIPGDIFGRVAELRPGYAKVSLITTEIMAADEKGLLNGGVIFAAAFLAAMASVNDPNVAPLSSESEFLAPVKVGDTITFEAYEKFQKGKRREIEVIGSVNDIKIFTSTFIALVFEEHILKSKLPQYE